MAVCVWLSPQDTLRCEDMTTTCKSSCWDSLAELSLHQWVSWFSVKPWPITLSFFKKKLVCIGPLFGPGKCLILQSFHLNGIEWKVLSCAGMVTHLHNLLFHLAFHGVSCAEKRPSWTEPKQSCAARHFAQKQKMTKNIWEIPQDFYWDLSGRQLTQRNIPTWKKKRAGSFH